MVIFIIKKIKQSKIKNQILIQAIFLNFAFTDIFFVIKNIGYQTKAPKNVITRKKSFCQDKTL